jgi:hypothetical protein
VCERGVANDNTSVKWIICLSTGREGEGVDICVAFQGKRMDCDVIVCERIALQRYHKCNGTDCFVL